MNPEFKPSNSIKIPVVKPIELKNVKILNKSFLKINVIN